MCTVNCFAGESVFNTRMLALTDKQKEWVRTQEELMAVRVRSKVRCPTVWWRKAAYIVYTYSHFDDFIMLCILLNTVRASRIRAR